MSCFTAKTIASQLGQVWQFTAVDFSMS